ncbi:hypothetical protein PHSY_001155 [Pseudozyma hubeiensis SY62]|uniref:Uncharacterized protein n=1 Tax=Pseudozyma hubeiensis (strain SY62) TaxID=1305764 RepID=R9P648_PSEHS|nr:hypothetical protein PHSY_001155 [Pseudozyma hubeiensis SY62]GAC93590.1 hypothetical protein PHSY_001155 [Pseudozyma hubeiensis SY62]
MCRARRVKFPRKGEPFLSVRQSTVSGTRDVTTAARHYHYRYYRLECQVEWPRTAVAITRSGTGELQPFSSDCIRPSDLDTGVLRDGSRSHAFSCFSGSNWLIESPLEKFGDADCHKKVRALSSTEM